MEGRLNFKRCVCHVGDNAACLCVDVTDLCRGGKSMVSEIGHNGVLKEVEREGT